MILLYSGKMQAVLEKQSYILLSRSDVESLMCLDPANASLQNSFGQLDNDIPDAGIEVEIELSDLLLDMCPIKQQENLIHDDQKLILLASLSDSLEYLADSVERLGESFISPSTISENKSDIHQSHHTRTTSAIPKSLASLANEYRRLATDCVRVLRLEMQLETIYHMQVIVLKFMMVLLCCY
uniref:Exocyst complex component Sec8 n=1 Tax=Aegilops tauschii subsp. strangulata TaxID=200361 RepID=A0A453RTN2_AEGTS